MAAHNSLVHAAVLGARYVRLPVVATHRGWILAGELTRRGNLQAFVRVLLGYLILHRELLLLLGVGSLTELLAGRVDLMCDVILLA